MKDVIRRCRFAPYRKGCGPTFALELWDTGQRMEPNHSRLGYCLAMYAEGERWVLFRAEDYGVPSHQAIDSDAAVRSLMTFLTLREGDTDAEFFAGDDDLVREYRDQHAEDLSTYMLLSWRGGDPEYR